MTSQLRYTIHTIINVLFINVHQHLTHAQAKTRDFTVCSAHMTSSPLMAMIRAVQLPTALACLPLYTHSCCQSAQVRHPHCCQCVSVCASKFTHARDKSVDSVLAGDHWHWLSSQCALRVVKLLSLSHWKIMRRNGTLNWTRT